MLTVRRAKKIEKAHTHTSNRENRRLRKMYTSHTQSTGKLIDYLPTDRGC
jgi:hypothetical protein